MVARALPLGLRNVTDVLLRFIRPVCPADTPKGKLMKKMNYYHAVTLAALLASAGFADAQTSVTTTTTSAGTVANFNPQVMTIRTVSSPTPVSYTFSRTTTYVDENGNPVSRETVTSGAPVTVYYSQDGDRMIASKVVVRKSVTTDTTPTEAPTVTTTPPVAPQVIETHKTTSTTTTTTTPNE
jgi:hypothetical protein